MRLGCLIEIGFETWFWLGVINLFDFVYMSGSLKTWMLPTLLSAKDSLTQRVILWHDKTTTIDNVLME